MKAAHLGENPVSAANKFCLASRGTRSLTGIEFIESGCISVELLNSLDVFIAQNFLLLGCRIWKS